MVEIVGDERGALEEAQHFARQRGLQGSPVHPGRVLISCQTLKQKQKKVPNVPVEL